MNLHEIKELLKGLIAEKINTVVDSVELTPVGGGSINDTYRVKINHKQQFFLKLNTVTAFPGLFEKEKNGLAFLERQHCIRIPSVVVYTTTDNYQLLLLEWIEGGIRHDAFWKKFGEQLAALHAVSQEDFGFMENNYMGSLPQVNTLTTDWPNFFVSCRLQPQAALARDKNWLDKQHIGALEQLYKKLDSVFNTERPSLLHGDLWSGNFMCDDQSSPVLVDPAVYFGHRSMDLAMTTLFGGFNQSFYDAYHYHAPLPTNYEEQWQICNLYPLLIHLNLFGKSYLSDITHTLRKFT